MSLTFGFYNSIGGDRTYDAIQFGQIFDGIITDGIYATYLKAMVVKASDNPSEVIVQPGRAWFNHTWTYVDADYPVEAPAPEVILDRVDTLVLDVNAEYSDRENKIIWVQGTPASVNPEAPSLINTTTHHQYPLCNVYRKAGTTMIYAADITNRVGTSATPFVTGVLTGINIDDLLSQWDDEFHTWENNTKTSFEAWMLNQQSVYTTWFESIRTQMEGDLTSFEAWFETIRGIIDEEAATHLQAEIDELKDMLPAGSHIDISTNESTLFNRNVTVSDGVHSKTVQFNAVGGATVESFPYIGAISVTSTDGERTAQETINIPYFGRYSVVLAFWAATVNLIGDSAVGGVPVTVKDSDDLTITTIVLDASGRGTFTATKPDTYKFSYTYGGQTMETTLQVTQETTYEVEIHGGFNYQAWLTAGRVSGTFESLDEILADEETLRQLFLVHDSVDYICNTFNAGSTADVTKIFNTDLSAKWINLSDYALDHFGAVPGIKSIMDTADKYGYGEWALMPQVPNMTANTAPYGTAYANSIYQSGGNVSAAWYAFSKTDTRGWTSMSASNVYVQYQFPSPVCINHVTIWSNYNASQTENYAYKNFKIQASNDDSTYVDLYTGVNTNKAAELSISLDNSTEYTYYRLLIIDGYGGTYINARVQFYAWTPKGNVPKMTSNTAPYGEASASSQYSATYAAWKAFDENEASDDRWASTGSATGTIQYKFANPVCVRRVYINNAIGSGNTTCQLKASNDGTTWDNIDDPFTVDSNARKTQDISNDKYYLYWMISGTNSTSGSTVTFRKLQFYGRELKVSVPTMTSNTVPYGTTVCSSAQSSYEAYRGFDNNKDTAWISTDNSFPAYLGYRFTNKKIKLCMLLIQNRNVGGTNTNYPTSFNVQGSNDNFTSDINDLASNLSATSTAAAGISTYTIDTSDLYSDYRVYVASASGTSGGIVLSLASLQFYGLDYSEKEFEAGTTKKWLYDHGVELETLTPYTTGTASINKKANVLNLVAPASDTRACLNYNVDFTNYDLERCKIENLSGQLILGVGSGLTGASIANVSAIDTIISKDLVINVSSINTTYYADVYANYNTKAANVEISEWWLE